MEFEKNQAKEFEISSSDQQQQQTQSKPWKKITIIIIIAASLIILAAIFIPLYFFVFTKNTATQKTVSLSTTLPFNNIVAYQENQRLTYFANNKHQIFASSKQETKSNFSNKDYQDQYSFFINITVLNLTEKQLYVTFYDIQNIYPKQIDTNDKHYKNYSGEILQFLVKLNSTYGLQSIQGSFQLQNSTKQEQTLLKFFIGYIKMLIPSIDSKVFDNVTLGNSFLGIQALDIDHSSNITSEIIQQEKDNMGLKNVHKKNIVYRNSSLIQLNSTYDYNDLINGEEHHLDKAKVQYAQSNFIDYKNKTLVNTSTVHSYEFSNNQNINNSYYYMNSTANFSHSCHIISNEYVNSSQLSALQNYINLQNYKTYAQNEQEVDTLLNGNNQQSNNNQNNDNLRVLQEQINLTTIEQQICTTIQNLTTQLDSLLNSSDQAVVNSLNQKELVNSTVTEIISTIQNASVFLNQTIDEYIQNNVQNETYTAILQNITSDAFNYYLEHLKSYAATFEQQEVNNASLTHFYDNLYNETLRLEYDLDFLLKDNYNKTVDELKDLVNDTVNDIAKAANDLLNWVDELGESKSKTFNKEIHSYDILGYSYGAYYNYNGTKDNECAGITNDLSLLVNSYNLYNLNLDTSNPISYGDTDSFSETVFDYNIPTPLYFSIELSLVVSGSVSYSLSLNDNSINLSFNGQADITGNVGVDLFVTVGLYCEGVFLDTTLSFDMSLINNTANNNCEVDFYVDLAEVPISIDVGINYKLCPWFCDYHDYDLWSDSFDAHNYVLYNTTF